MLLVPVALVGPVLVVATSAEGVMVVMTLALLAVPLLLDESGSNVEEVQAAELVNEPLAGAVTVTVKLVVEMLVIAGQVTTPAE